MDFISHYGLLVDPRNKRLIDRITNLSAREYAAASEAASIKTIIGDTNYHRLLAEYPDGHHASTCFRTRNHLTRCGTSHQGHVRTSSPQQTTPPRSRPTQAGEGGIRDDHAARSDTAIEKSMGIITPARRSDEGRRPTTLGRQQDIERAHSPRQVFATAHPRFRATSTR
jgi:hypothetical protein